MDKNIQSGDYDDKLQTPPEDNGSNENIDNRKNCDPGKVFSSGEIDDQYNELDHEMSFDEDSKNSHHNMPFGELLIGEMIESVEFILGTISNTASYLR